MCYGEEAHAAIQVGTAELLHPFTVLFSVPLPQKTSCLYISVSKRVENNLEKGPLEPAAWEGFGRAPE